MIPIKSEKEIEIMRQAGKILAQTMKEIVPYVKRGVSAMELDRVAENFILSQKAEPAFKGYGHKSRPYPSTLCVSVNEEVVHGIPRKNKILNSGDIVGIDCGVKFQGYYSDMAITLGVEKISPSASKLIEVTQQSLERAISIIKPGIRLGDISWTIQSFVEKNGFSIVRQLTGHGIGRELHENPSIFNYGDSETGPILKSGMVLAIEPMVNLGDWKIETGNDGWTIINVDRSLSAHFEHTILITSTGVEVLTKI